MVPIHPETPPERAAELARRLGATVRESDGRRYLYRPSPVVRFRPRPDPSPAWARRLAAALLRRLPRRSSIGQATRAGNSGGVAGVVQGARRPARAVKVPAARHPADLEESSR